jgi:hypothetical protein
MIDEGTSTVRVVIAATLGGASGGALVGLREAVTHDANWAKRTNGRLQMLIPGGQDRWSGLSIRILNCMTAGRPVIAAEGAAKGIIDGKTGLVSRNGDAAGFGSCL